MNVGIQDVAAAQRTDENVLDREAIKRAFLDNLFCVQGKTPSLATRHDYYMALAYTVRDWMMHRWISTAEAYTAHGSRTVAYLSAEFLIGPQLGNNLLNLGMLEPVRTAMRELGFDLTALLECEDEPGLGNGGLGRLAACFLDSMATLEIPSLGYGIRYEFGIFDQEIVDGWQVERTDKWLRYGNPWEIARPEWAVEVRLGGRTEHYTDAEGRMRARWIPHRIVNGVPYDTPILGYKVSTANTLRLWRAEAPESFDFAIFNRGDYYGAVNQKVVSENLSKVLYPNDEVIQGKELRLEQQYFFVCCSLQDMLRILRVQHIPISRFHEKFCVQLNDTHPAIAVAELMRLLVDEYTIEWETAWSIVRRTFGYTNHTLLPEALEHWSIPVFAKVLPRHLEIIYEINARFLDEVRIRFFGDETRLARLSIIDEQGPRYVRMAHLACVGSQAVNGVAELHTQLLQESVLKDFHALSPATFSNKTNGVTPRRFLSLANPRLAALICEAIGESWMRDLARLEDLEAFADDPAFQQRWWQIKRANKEEFAAYARDRAGVAIDPDSMFDVQVKRIHEYKRQHLNILHVIALYHRLRCEPSVNFQPRTVIFGGKAAPGYHLAKLIIKLIHSVAEVVNRDPAVQERLKVVFLPNFNVKNGQRIYPVADASEQISTAGKEASGTGNMKFCMNGALTIGTLDGANIEIRREVGAENFFMFGLTAAQIDALRADGYRPAELYDSNTELRQVIDLIRDGFFSRGDTEQFRAIVDGLLESDPYMLLADFPSYLDCQNRLGRAYENMPQWTRMSILNVARSGFFSSDRAVREYAEDLWHVPRVPIKLPHQIAP
ncbi:MAG: glycogen/starch/alpha-glucan phosphorylase [Steroidobacteraceae bacterium]